MCRTEASRSADGQHMFLTNAHVYAVDLDGLMVAYRLEYSVEDTNWAKVAGLMSRSSFNR